VINAALGVDNEQKNNEGMNNTSSSWRERNRTMYVAHMNATWHITERNIKLLLQQLPPFIPKPLSPV
jgi:phage-related protein